MTTPTHRDLPKPILDMVDKLLCDVELAGRQAELLSVASELEWSDDSDPIEDDYQRGKAHAEDYFKKWLLGRAAKMSKP